MKDILKQLYDGGFDLAEQITPDTATYKAQLARVAALDRAFRTALPEALHADYDVLVKARHTLTAIEVKEACMKGMKIGGRLAAELLNGYEESENHGETEFES